MREEDYRLGPRGPDGRARFDPRGPDKGALGLVDYSVRRTPIAAAPREGNGRLVDAVEQGNAFYERQMADIAELITPANDVAVISRTGELRPSARRKPAERRNMQGAIVALTRSLREDHMMRNSLYLVLNSGLQAGFGFSFWIIAAHLFSTADVGKASALISAMTVIAYLALLGLNNGFGRFLPTARNRDSLISSGLVMVAICGGMIGLAYAYLTPFIAPRLAFIAQNPALAIGFGLVTAAAAINILTDSVFVAGRRAGYTAFLDGIVAGAGKIILAVALAGTSVYGLFLATATGTALAALSSLGFIYTVMHTRLRLERPLATLKPLLRFSSANYIGNVLNMLPTLVVPVIALDRLGPSSAAYYFVVFQVVSILYAAALALEQTFLAEGSRANANMRRLRRRSLRILVTIFLPAAAGMFAIGHWLLLAFGRGYYHYGWRSFLLLVVAAGPITAIYWCLTVLRLAGKLRSIITVNATYAASVCALAWFGSAYGLTALSAAWPIGALIAAVVATVSIPRARYSGRRRSVRAQVPANGVVGVTRVTSVRSHRKRELIGPKRTVIDQMLSEEHRDELRRYAH
jgi:O-antigen/teichoic acid export membrane protein